MRFVAGRGAIGKKLAGKSAQKPRFCASKARKRGFRRQKAHKNADFVLEKPENGGSKAQKRTKTPILCSGGLVCALSVGQQPAGSRKHPADNQKKTACNQNTPAGNKKKTAGHQNTPPLPATRNQPPGIKKGLPEPRDGVPADLYANTVIADYCSLSPFMEIRNSWLLIVFSSLFFINSIASTLFISAR